MHLGLVLEKATLEKSLYLIELVTGQQFMFGQAEIIDRDDWVELCPVEKGLASDCQFTGGPVSNSAYVIRNGSISIRKAAIAWVAESSRHTA